MTRRERELRKAVQEGLQRVIVKANIVIAKSESLLREAEEKERNA